MTTHSTPEPWSELADLVLRIAREIQFRGYTDPDAVGLSPSEGTVMRRLQHVDESTPTELAAETGLQRTNLSVVLRSLESKGLVERSTSPRDRRYVTVSATERGNRNYRLVRQEWGRAVSEAAGGDGDDLEAALSLLRAIESGLVEARPATSGRSGARAE
ncbi:MarR family winged helix-turn-helix transcriptional regulator [Antribacter sp. KLBMP9083]|uniref:MarR family winged helix-turn-helix transcriptional regulator n=1 Tax=Antribacter soli TaxID=2910976 RepID=A0AA41QH18_9MICO|nr:MarR family winged helix-turn-helix transcriptional regulator [Antribacter soli]MCF4121944.1 MarR family winged helix-turn-helix transcriptional regulator [Antribacter soli]